MPSNKVEVLNDLNFDAVISGANGPVLVDFTATWCGPCRLQKAILEQFAEKGGVLVATCDVDDCPELTARFSVRGMPTLVAFENGKETGRRLGLANEHAIAALLSRSARPPLAAKQPEAEGAR